MESVARNLDRDTFLACLGERAAESATPFGLLVFKLGHLRQINHSYGYGIGDLCLVTCCQRLQEAARSCDIVGHLGGDQFALLVAAPCDEALLELAVNRMFEAINRPLKTGSRAINLSVRAAGILHQPPGHGGDLLLSAAEAALHEVILHAEAYRLVCATHDSLHSDDYTVLQSIGEALENDEFEIYLQPQVHLDDGSISGFEALLRWNNEAMGSITRDRFITLAERDEVIFPLTRWTFNTALREYRTLVGAGNRAKLSINLSTVLLTDTGLQDIISDALAIWGVAPQRLTVEITETAMMINPDESIAAVERLHALGTGISIDDFGTGYSSLAYLEQLPVSELKIDKSFVRRVTDNPHDRRIVQAIIELAHTFEMEVVAEGIETEATAELLRQLGCDIGQGYYFCEPLPPVQLRDWLAERTATTAIVT